MKRLRFIMIGGFLGAGKTTTMARLARHYAARGRRVGLVTNDQAQDLVDTNSLRAQGFSVEEVAGACFCCRFDDLVGKVGRLEAGERPDVILAEPVGSCTDLVATVVQPLRDLYGDHFDVAPYAVLFKPDQGLRILRNESRTGFSPKAAYIFRKQLEEADAIVINRIDEMTAEARAELAALTAKEYPSTPILQMSAKTGQGFDALTELLDQQGAFGRKILDIDYDTYAEGEAEMGWLNAAAEIVAWSGDHATTGDAAPVVAWSPDHATAGPFDLDAMLMRLIEQLRDAFGRLGVEPGHLKVIGLHDASFGVANLVSSGVRPELSLPSRGRVAEAEVIVNARVAADPAVIECEVRLALDAVSREFGAKAVVRSLQSFRPGRPQPTHRYAAAK